jgi:exodeoxyribonuclease VII large subunit
MNTDTTVLTVTQLNNQVQYTVEKKFSQVWIKGEISSFKPYPSGHIYFTLKDSTSEISCVLFAQYRKGLTGEFTTGQEVILFGDASIYTQRGSYQFIAKNIYSSGKGNLWLAYEQLKERLTLEGLFDSESKKDIPQYPSRIGVVTSQSGSVLRDIINVITRRAPHVEIILRSAKVQGVGAGKQIADAINDFNNYGKIDVMIIGRGGGSMEDLWCFNEEIVARAIFSSTIPIVSAVGHETDYSIADLVADLRAPTPSAAAELTTPNRNDLLMYIDEQMNKSQLIIQNSIRTRLENIEHIQNRYAFQKPSLLLERMKEKITILSLKIKSLVEHEMDSFHHHLDTINKNLIAMNPYDVLKRGYTLVTHSDGKILSSSKNICKSDEIHVKFHDGNITANVKEVVNDTQK